MRWCAVPSGSGSPDFCWVSARREIFPRRSRRSRSGFRGSNVGAIIAALMVPFVAGRWGWRYAFLFTGALSIVWLIVWLTVFRTPALHPAVSSAELAYIQSDPPEPATRIPWAHLFGYRQTWAFVTPKFMTDPIWWFFVFWLPKYLNSEYGLTLTTLGPPLIVIYCMADAGSIAGGWLAARFIRRGWSVNRARKTAMLVCALAVVPIVFVSMARDLWMAVALIGLATAGHQGWSANLFTLTSDMFPQRAVASVVGLGGFAGAVGGMLISTVIGLLLQTTGSYVAVFTMAASTYLLALAALQGIAPHLEPAQMRPLHADRIIPG
jgi:ACS family hexuronate transporter-like MFS transporter